MKNLSNEMARSELYLLHMNEFLILEILLVNYCFSFVQPILSNTIVLFVAAHPFLSIAIDPSTGHIIVGSADGKVTEVYCIALLCHRSLSYVFTT